MSLRINDPIPDLTVTTDQGDISLRNWVGDGWAIIFSHPKDFTPVCTTEFGAVAQLADEWAARGVKVMGVSVDGVEDHVKWKGDIEAASDEAQQETGDAAEGDGWRLLATGQPRVAVNHRAASSSM